MMGGLFVWAGGRWCELDAATGRVRGWRRRARFVYRARGRLQLASTAAVLRGLRALLAGQPSSVRDSAPLSQRRRKRPSLTKKSLCSMCKQHQHCCANNLNNSSNNNVNEKPLNIRNEEPPSKVEAGVQVTLPSLSQNKPAGPLSRTKRKRSISSETHVIRRQVRVDVHKSSSDENHPSGKTQDSSDIPLAQRCKIQEYTNDSSQKQSQQVHCKELVINEEDVDLYRSYLIKNDPKFNVNRFDSDENYKLSIFFRINPLVNLERCAQIERLLRNSQSSQEMSLKGFATKLGLRSISDTEETNSRYKMRSRAEKIVNELESDEETDKENLLVERKDYPLNLKSRKKILEDKERERKNVQEIRPRKKLYSETLMAQKNLLTVQDKKDKEHTLGRKGEKGTKDDDAIGASSTSDSDFVKKPVRPVAKKTSPVKKLPNKANMPNTSNSKRSVKSYSNMEDHAIVAWVSSGPRARMVNGNRLWRELQPQYRRLTGLSRSWHSLRNRYLRYILPALGALALPPAHAQRLRAAAAAGELKSKGRPRRNPLFALAPVRSASARARRPHAEASDASDSQTSPRVLRSSAAHESPARRGRTTGRSDRPTSESDKSKSDRRQRSRDILRGESSDGDTDSDEEINGGRNVLRNKSRDGLKTADQSLDRAKDNDAASRASRSKAIRPNGNVDESDRSKDGSLRSHSALSRSANGRFKKRGRSENKSSRSKQRDVVRDLSDDSRKRSRDGLAKFLNRSEKGGLRDQSDDRRGSLRVRRDPSDERRGSLQLRRDPSDDRRGSLRLRRDPSDDRRGSLRLRRDPSDDRRGNLRERRDRSSEGARTPTYDQLTRQFATRLRSTPVEPATKSRPTKSPPTKLQSQARTRKLYNPNALMR